MIAIATAMGLTAIIAGAMTMSSLQGSDWDAKTPSTSSHFFGSEGVMATVALTASIVLAVIAG